MKLIEEKGYESIHYYKGKQVTGEELASILEKEKNYLYDNPFSVVTGTYSPHIKYRDDSQISMEDIMSEIKRVIAPQKLLEKCRYCGQYGTVMGSCPKCGAPIDQE